MKKLYLSALVVAVLLVLVTDSDSTAADDPQKAYEMAVGDLQKAGFAGVDAALSRFEAIVAKNPRFVAAHLGAADAYILKYEFSKKRKPKWLDRALELLDSALKIKPDLARGFFTRALIYFNKGDKKSALADLRMAMEKKPTYLEPKILYLQHLLGEKKPKKAEAFATEALKAFPKNPAPVKYFADVFFQEGAWEEAITYYEKVVGMVERAPLSYLAMGRAYQALGKHDKAIKAIKKSLSQNPDLYEAHFSLGISLVEKGGLKEAVTHYERYLLHFPKDYSALNNLAILYEKTGKPTQAAVIWLKVKKISKDPVYLKRAERHLRTLGQNDSGSADAESDILITGE